jgi:hypothetical protein
MDINDLDLDEIFKKFVRENVTEAELEVLKGDAMQAILVGMSLGYSIAMGHCQDINRKISEDLDKVLSNFK